MRPHAPPRDLTEPSRFRDETNARNFPGLNFSRDELADSLTYAHARGAMVFLAVNTYASAGNSEPWLAAIKSAADLKVDAVILADIGLLAHAHETYPDLRLHLSVQASASNAAAINYYHHRFDIKRVVLPRVLTLQDISRLNREIAVETEVLAFGGMCPMAEGRCTLSSYVTGKSPNRNGVCSPASHVEYIDNGQHLTSKLGGFTINRFQQGEQAGYPTLCKGRFRAGGDTSYLFEEPTSLDISGILPDLAKAGVTALKIEGRQRSKAYVKKVVQAFRQAVDTAAQGGTARLDMADLSEGQQNTTGAYVKKWM